VQITPILWILIKYVDTNYVDFGIPIVMWQFEDNSTSLPWFTGILFTFGWNKYFLELLQSYKHWFTGIDVEIRMVYKFCLSDSVQLVRELISPISLYGFVGDILN